MPKMALPSVFDGMSFRWTTVPMIWKSPGFLRTTVLRLGTGSLEAAATNTPSFALLFPLEIMPLFMRQDSGATFHRFAAAVISMMRAEAAAWRMGIHEPATL